MEAAKPDHSGHLGIGYLIDSDQGRFKIWTEHSTMIFLNPKPFEIVLQKFQKFYSYKRNEFSPNLEGVAQKIGQILRNLRIVSFKKCLSNYSIFFQHIFRSF